MRRRTLRDWFKTIIKKSLLFLFRCTYGFYITRRLNVHVTRNDMKKLKGSSFILLGNHVTNYDGFLFQHHAARNVSFVINDKMFRSTFLRNILLLLDMIPKKKSSNDIQAVRRLFKAKERGDVIGIFPEGRRSWDGVTAPIVKGTATLVKSVKLPVVVGLIKGGTTASPRWRDNDIYRGIVEIEYVQILSKEDVKSMNVQEIMDALIEGLKYNESKYLKEKNIIYKGNNRAKGMERFFFMCPSCRSIGSLKSNGNDIACSCGLKVHYNEYGLLTGGPFDNTAEWNKWQREQLALLVKEDEITFYDDAIEFFAAKGYDPFKLIARGTARLSRHGLTISNTNHYEFSLENLYGVNVQANNAIEFTKDDVCYRLKFPDYRSAYKWQALIYTLLNKPLEGNL